MVELKNCPNCGGILDDTGRCMYCKSKVYNLTDVNINFDTRSILVFKIRQGGNDVLFSAFPTHASLEFNDKADYFYAANGARLCHFSRGQGADLHMDFSLVSRKDDNELITMVTEE